MTTFTIFLLGTISAYRLARLLNDDLILEPLRKHLYVETEEGLSYRQSFFLNMLGKLFNCYWCMGFWTSVMMLSLYLYNFEFYIYTSLVLTSSTVVAFIHEIMKKVEN